MASEGSRSPLNRSRIIDAAIALADEDGLAALSMRRLGKVLGVEGMALYNHVANKDDLLGGIIDVVLAEIPLPEDGVDWREAMRTRAEAARRVFLRHPWALGLLEGRPANSSPSRLRYFDSVLGSLRSAGFTSRASMQAFSVIDSYVYGFIMQEINLPFDDSESLQEVGEDLMRQMADAYPHLTEATADAMADGWDHRTQFGLGLDLILDALAQWNTAATSSAENRSGRSRD